LDFQRPTPGERRRHGVSALLDDVLRLADKQLQRHGVTVVRESHDELKSVLVVGDQIKQVFLNLLLNTVEAMPDGGELRVCTAQSNGAVSVAFTDTGSGIPPEVMDRIFEPFFSTKPKGSGLGLAVSHQIVTRHGGSLEVNSMPGQGATFTVSLPIHSD
jgi:signal transduction histidine kinase